MKKPKKNPAAVALGKLGGPKRMALLTVEERKALGRKAINARWAKHFDEHGQSMKPAAVYQRERRARLKREKAGSE